jgi:hypothetical protein
VVQVHVTPRIVPNQPHVGQLSPAGRVETRIVGQGLAKLPYTCGQPIRFRGAGSKRDRGGGFLVVKKLLVVILLGLAAFAVWRKVQSDRAELDLWTEATAADDD